MKYTIYRNRFVSATGAKAHVVGEWSDIVTTVTNKSTWPTFNATDKDAYSKAKEQFDAVVMAEMKPNTARTAENVIAFHAIVLDIDDGATYQDVRNDLKDYEYVFYSSGGTGLKEGDRFRVILPLNTPMKTDQWKQYNTSLTERFPYSDECFNKGIQIQYLPVVNTAYADQFITEHHTGKWFDYQNPQDLPFVENLSVETIVKNVIFNEAQFSTDEYAELARAIVDFQSGQLEYEERRKLAQRLKHIGMPDFDIIQILAQVSRPGYSVSNESIVRGANSQYAHVEGLYKHVAKGTRIPAIERRIVRHSASVSVVCEVSKYDGEWTLEQNEYLSDVVHDMDFTTGVNLLIADVGTGKTVHWTKEKNVKFVAPLTSIVESMGDVNSLTKGNVGTWNQIQGIINTKDKSIFKDQTLVVDECHGLFSDYGYKSTIINRLINTFSSFKSVVLMSGTVDAEHFSSISFNKVYRVHKASKARKDIRTIFCTKKDDVVIDHIQNLTNKTIVLMNNKDLCEVVASRITRKSLVVNADVKKTLPVQSFFKNKAMDDYEVIIGTNSIVEGLSIEDDLTDVDVVIWSDLSPERIEQFTNRFRNVSGSKNVWYFIDKKPVELMEDYNRTEIIKEANTLCTSLQDVYEGLKNDMLKRSFTRQFSGDMARDMIYFHDGKFAVSFTGIDYEFSVHREIQYRNDFASFSSRLNQFGFNVYYPLMEDGNEDKTNDINEDKKAVSEARKKERESVLEQLSHDIDSNTVLEEEDAPELYNATYESLQKLLAKGMDKTQVSYAINEYIDDESFFAKAHEDADFIKSGNTIRELIIDEVNSRTELTTIEIQDVADKVTVKVLNEYFAGDVDKMIESRSWGGLVVKMPTGALQAKSTKASKTIIEKYISVGKSERKRINGVQQSVSPIKALSRTGLVFAASCAPYSSNDLYNEIPKVHSNDVQQSSTEIVIPESKCKVDIARIKRFRS